jgi:hypothetical protein
MEKIVDLFTHDRDLEDLMLSEFPGKIFPEQYEKDTTENPHLFCFYGLDYMSVSDFLKNKNFEYELKDSSSGKLVLVSKQIPLQNLN